MSNARSWSFDSDPLEDGHDLEYDKEGHQELGGLERMQQPISHCCRLGIPVPLSYLLAVGTSQLRCLEDNREELEEDLVDLMLLDRSGSA